MGYNLSIISVFGMIALCGVVINGGLVFMDSGEPQTSDAPTPICTANRLSRSRYRADRDAGGHRVVGDDRVSRRFFLAGSLIRPTGNAHDLDSGWQALSANAILQKCNLPTHMF